MHRHGLVMFGPQRHENLASALAVPPGGSVIDLGCGSGPTLAALAARVDSATRLVGVDLAQPQLSDDLEAVVADLNEALPFADETFGAAVCQNVLECRFCDSVQPWMTVADGTVGRRLVAIARQSPLQLVKTFAWVGHHTTFEAGGPAHMAAKLVAAEGRRDPALAEHVEGWLADLQQQADNGQLLYSINDYAVLLRKPQTSRDAPPTRARAPTSVRKSRDARACAKR